eukprot:6940495-Pyramimonas_sp.AAC.1
MEQYYLQVSSAQGASRDGEPERLAQSRGDQHGAHRHAYRCWRTAAFPPRTQGTTGGHDAAVT